MGCKVAAALEVHLRESHVLSANRNRKVDLQEEQICMAVFIPRNPLMRELPSCLETQHTLTCTKTRLRWLGMKYYFRSSRDVD